MISDSNTSFVRIDISVFMKATLLALLFFNLNLGFSQIAIAQQTLSDCAIDYPKGDVPKDKGVCTDVVIRAYPKIEIDTI